MSSPCAHDWRRLETDASICAHCRAVRASSTSAQRCADMASYIAEADLESLPRRSQPQTTEHRDAKPVLNAEDA